MTRISYFDKFQYLIAFSSYSGLRIFFRFFGRKKRKFFFDKHHIRLTSFIISKSILIKKNDSIFQIRKNEEDFDLISEWREQERITYFNLKPNEVFLDIGANCGFYSILIKKKFPESKIISIEPHPETFQLLKKNIELNKLDCTLINKAVFKTKTILKLFEQEFWCGHSSLYANFDKYVEVESDTLDNILSSIGQWAHVIKIDAEGSEVDILEGAENSLRNCRLISIEIHADNLEKIKTILAEHDFKITTLTKEGDVVIGTK